MPANVKRGVVIQCLSPRGDEDWRLWREAGATQVLVGIPWASLEPEKGRFNRTSLQPVGEIARAGLRPIVRLLWPMPAWCPKTWAAVDQDGNHTTDPDCFLRIGASPCMWNEDAWRAVEQAQSRIVEQYGDISLSPPGAGGGEWTHPTSHIRKPELARSLWCFSEYAQAMWRRRVASRGYGERLPLPRSVADAYHLPVFGEWYRGGLHARMAQQFQAAHSLCLSVWMSPIIKPGNFPENYAAGQLGLDRITVFCDCAVIIHCLFGPGNTPDSVDANCDMFTRLKHPVAVGVEGWRGLSDNVPFLARTEATHLLISSDGLETPEGFAAFKHWAEWWKKRH